MNTKLNFQILKKSGYYQGYDMDHKFIGYKEEENKLIIEFAIFRVSMYPLKTSTFKLSFTVMWSVYFSLV